MIDRVWAAAAGTLRTLTPGQRWTAGLALALAFAVVLFGLPTSTVGTRTAVADAPEHVVTELAPGSPYAPRAPRPVRPATPAPGEPEVARPTRRVPLPPPAPSPGGTRVAALVRTDAAAPGRDDASIAKVFLTRAGISAAFVPLEGEDEEVCSAVASTADVVVAGDGLGAPLRDCLSAAAPVVVSYDQRGGLAGKFISTARSVSDSLVEIGSAAGDVGIVAAASYRTDIARAISGLKSRGVRVVATAFLEDGDVDPVAAGALAFAEKGVDTILFAVSVRQQSAWASKQSVVSPSVRYVVADAADAIWNESYTAAFDGALAYTTVRVRWFARENKETPEQTVCREAYEQQVTPAGALSTAELVSVYRWCQHAALLRIVLDGVSAGRSPADVVAGAAVPSPLTSDLGPIERGFGPREQAVLRWAAACSCWQSIRPFAPRTS